jgi:hypothetical protein
MKLNRKDFNVLVQSQAGQPGEESQPQQKGMDVIPPDGQSDGEGDGEGDGDGTEKTKSTVTDLKKPGQQSKPESGDGTETIPGEGKGSGKGKPGEGGEGEGQGEGGEGGQGSKPGQGKASGAGKPGSGETDGSKGTQLEIGGRGIGGVLSPEESKRMQSDLGVPYEAPFDESAIKNKLNELYPLLDKSSGSRNAGSGAGNQKRLLPDAISKILRPVVNWKALLKKFIARTLGKKEEDILPNRRYVAGGDYVQGTKELNNNFNTCVIAVDTSGSMGAKELLTILNEIKGLAQTNRINNFDIVYFDDGIRDVEHLTTAKIKSYNPSPPGGGGTTFKEPLEYMEKIRKTGKLDLAIFMTDGYADLNLPVPRYKDKFIWVILDNPSFKAPWGSKLVHIEVPRGKS